ncbi:unnamed protein product [Blepharisma stoltei]|uniref:Uncharacterized protein n=1 Tax=Blepharisma stoltei TaxID=1481888 RepID=A0AAU9IUB2_9CILI|nr:unnamed protein product [Blepharisma stoltei]
MSKVDEAEKWKKKAAELQFKVNEMEGAVAKLQSEDNTSDAKIESLNKLHAQKVRALMNSIQDLKKQTAMAKAQNKESNRSKLIDKLKTELVQQEIAIQALRDLIRDDEKCDEQIIEYLNKGPPRIRPLSREEMRIQIRRLKGKLSTTSKRSSEQALDDLDRILNPPDLEENEEMKNIDPLQNEKIIELLEEIENLKLDLKSKETAAESLKKQNKKLSEALQSMQMKENGYEIIDIKVNKLAVEREELVSQLNQNAQIEGQTLARHDELEVGLKAAQEQINGLKKKLENNVIERQKSLKEIERLQKELAMSLASVRDLEGQIASHATDSESKVSDLHALLLQKDTKIADLETDVIEKDNEISELKSQQAQLVRKDTEDGKDFEIEVLRAKVKQLTQKANVPEDLIAAERSETEKYKQRVKDLTRQVAELQEQVEYLEQHNIEAQRQGSALYLAGKRPAEPKLPADYQTTKDLCEKLKSEIKEIKIQLQTRDRELLEARNELNSQKAAVVGLRQKVKQTDEEKVVLEQKIFGFSAQKQSAVDENSTIKEKVIEQSRDVIPKLRVGIPPQYNAVQLLKASRDVMNRLVRG